MLKNRHLLSFGALVALVAVGAIISIGLAQECDLASAGSSVRAGQMAQACPGPYRSLFFR